MGIIDWPLSQLLSPAPEQTLSIPLGFYLLEKLAIQLLGYSEYALKLFPLLFGVVSLFLFLKVAKQYINPKAVPIAVGLFAFLSPLIDLSSSVKPYTGDVAFALMLYLLANSTQFKKTNILPAVLLGGVGAVVLWCSHPSVFILFGIGITLSISFGVNKEWPKMKRLFIPLFIWGSGFLAVYLIYTQPLMYNFTQTNDSIFWMKQKAFMPFPPMSFADLQWFLDLPQRIFTNPVGLTFTGLATLCFIAGCINIFSGNKEHFFLLISPLLLTLLASALHKFVFSQTAILFLVPLFILFIAEGTEYIREKLSHSSNAIGIMLVVLLFIHPLSWASYRAIKPDDREAIRPVLTHIKKNWQKGDILYVYYMSQFAFEYYSKYHPGNYHFKNGEYIIGEGPQDWYATYKVKEFRGFWNKEKPFSQPPMEILKEYAGELTTLKGNKRVWVLFSSSVAKGGMLEENFFVYTLRNIGKQLDFFGTPGVSAVYLFDLS